MSHEFEGSRNARERVTSPEKIVMPKKARIVYDALREAGAEGLDNQQLLEILQQHGLVDVADGYDEVPYKISAWDETPYYDIDYVPRYMRLSVYDTDDLREACDLLETKGLMKQDRASKRWVVSTPEKSWEKQLHELPDVKLLRVSAEMAKGQIRRYQKEAAKAEVFVVGAVDVMESFTSSKDKYKIRQHKLTLSNGHVVDLSVSFSEETKERQRQIKIELSAQQASEQVLLAIEAPEGTLRALLMLETGKEINLPAAELGFDPMDTGLVFRALEASD